MADTIAAIATGGVISAIGIVRLSGDRAIEVADRVFRAFTGRTMAQTPDRKLAYGELLDEDGSVLDICLCTVSRGPGSYTGEDTAEFQCHGSPVMLAAALRAMFAAGARQALAGEFSRRAFLNGRMDLAQAEAVIDLIDAETVAAAKNAAGQLNGAVSKKADAIYSGLTDVCAHFHAVIDYPDEEIEPFEMARYAGQLADYESTLRQLLATYDRGRLLKEGVRCAIIGKPNVGKSSLLNLLAGYDRAIVTDIAGTTRDTIEEKISLGDVVLRVIDTAGIRQTEDTVEKLGVARSLEAADGADLVLAVFDGARAFTREDERVLVAAEKSARRLYVVNKSDEAGWRMPAELEGKDAVVLSASTGDGLDGLTDRIREDYRVGGQIPVGEIITNARHAEAISRAADSLHGAVTAAEEGVTPDAVLTMAEDAMQALGELTGVQIREDITNRIFSRFCVGK
ncbi:MAG: tRNA uridine-5-carboxymethylaminomethyl(34) synthesis GTPase MnmE [Oscillospiraceae bacterium]|nr:tRNA uridine-5-carboxymethylaminomethyl(34) synthesis GTPase MnmE [Oscillospiraceae bacterium]